FIHTSPSYYSRDHADLPSFPTRRSSDLTRQPVVMDFWDEHGSGPGECFTTIGNWRQPWRECEFNQEVYRWSKHLEFQRFLSLPSDRKSTRLNSSHVEISYAVFCLKKKIQ